ncbi:nickel pincer cofactor biosynthesis protein LarC [Nocardia terpenica]|uniref:Pyridinium-3,5-bisthiocarboxylic acid mononucleotide nickel insertion protein n=1 Tax=Nocardia terpenica TaxID=455432 RepID=A0A6G9Z043_9NOCA|nr:nickel pincer cofactor biosynthesis protein LarC [Nocardia terpenica]QIS18443.1 nickel pincer cofactor biosynthesis protein LarC [Nocardia terpenica]
MKTLWIDAGNGAAGDMLLGALLDAGADLDAVRTGIRQLSVEPIDVEMTQVRRHGLRAGRAVVTTAASEVARTPADIAAIIDAAPLAAEVSAFAHEAFSRLAHAESKVHGVSLSAIHFHEVGALDAIADIVGCALALHSLHLLDNPVRVVSPVAVGSGRVNTAHGPLPVPVPAVLELLTAAGAPLRGHHAEMELCTPTGAALLCTIARTWGSPPDCAPIATGTGAGQADPDGHPNVVRLVVGEAMAESGLRSIEMHRIDATIDDLDPRLWPDVLEKMRSIGAADAWCTPVLMRKGRPGHILNVLVDAQLLDPVCAAIFESTTTLGVRISPVERRSLRRDRVGVRIGNMVVHAKRGLLDGRVLTVEPEYDEVRAVAAATGRQMVELLTDVRQIAREM